MTDERRAIELHDLALSAVRSKGVTKLEGSTTVLKYRYGLLLIQYRSGKGELDVWFGAVLQSSGMRGSHRSCGTRRVTGNAT